MCNIKLKQQWGSFNYSVMVALVAMAQPAVAQDGWVKKSPRDEIRPEFAYNASGGPTHTGSLIIRTGDQSGLDGHWAKKFPVEGGRWYRFRVQRRVSEIASTDRHALARISWCDEQGQKVQRDAPGAKSYAAGKAPISEPEYPHEGTIDENGWVPLEGVYYAPSRTHHALVELHLRWAP